MERIPEPELMAEEAQAKAYAEGNYAEAHQRYVELFDGAFPDRPRSATVLDLGCGAGDVTIRYARHNPGYVIHAVDGSAAMLRHAAEALKTNFDLANRIRFIEGHIPGAPFPHKSYDVLLSNNFLHHLHRPQVLWQTVWDRSQPGTLVFVTDLFRPSTRAIAEGMVETYARDEPEILRRDFFNSLLAAFTPQEIQVQLTEALLTALRVQVISDRHVMVWGRIAANPAGASRP